MLFLQIGLVINGKKTNWSGFDVHNQPLGELRVAGVVVSATDPAAGFVVLGGRLVFLRAGRHLELNHRVGIMWSKVGRLWPLLKHRGGEPGSKAETSGINGAALSFAEPGVSSDDPGGDSKTGSGAEHLALSCGEGGTRAGGGAARILAAAAKGSEEDLARRGPP